MPNHVSNRLTVKGTVKQVAEVMSCLVKDEKVTFNGFAPMPEELRGTTSPTSIVSEAEYKEHLAEKALLESQLQNPMMTEDDKIKIQQKLDWMSIPITAKMQHNLIKKYGCDNWYDWSLANWGTKWGAYDSHICDENTVEFDTAWSTPVQAMLTLSAKFPKVKIVVDFADEDFGYNVGEYTVQNGEIIEENCPEGGSKEAIRKALDVKGDEDFYFFQWVTDEVSTVKELEAEIENGEFMAILMEIAYESKKVVSILKEMSFT